MSPVKVSTKRNLKIAKVVPLAEHKQSEGETCPAGMIESVLKIIGGKWKVLIVFHLHQNQVVRFGEMKRLIPGVTQRILTNQLREMEADGLVIRKVYAQIPPKVEYSLSPEGHALKAIFMEMNKWGAKNSKFVTKCLKSQESTQEASNG